MLFLNSSGSPTQKLSKYILGGDGSPGSSWPAPPRVALTLYDPAGVGLWGTSVFRFFFALERGSTVQAGAGW